MSSDLELLQGLWRQECASRNTRTEHFHRSIVTLSESFFTDDQCRSPFIVFINEGIFTLPQAGYMDFEFTSVRLLLKNPQLVEDFNQRQVCGFSDWQLDNEKEISGRHCEIFTIGSPHRIPSVGDTRYGIYHLQDDQLLFGRLTRGQNALTPEKRPTNFDPRPYRKSLSGL